MRKLTVSYYSTRQELNMSLLDMLSQVFSGRYSSCCFVLHLDLGKTVYNIMMKYHVKNKRQMLNKESWPNEGISIYHVAAHLR